MKRTLRRREDREQRTMKVQTMASRDCNPCSGTPSSSYITKRDKGHE